MKVIYVLRLEDYSYTKNGKCSASASATGKWYVGSTSNLQRRYEQHRSGSGSGAWWTRKYPPLEIVETREQHSIFDEDNITKEYMMLHGVDNVRGGAYCQITLPEYQLRALEQEFRHATGRCLTCGATDHRMCSALVRCDGCRENSRENVCEKFFRILGNYFYDLFTILDD